MNIVDVSICVATCNQERYIGECLGSVIAQAESLNCEILVGDDMSEDATSAIVASWVERYPNIIKHFRHARRLGPAENYQFIVAQARGRLLAHLDGDDMWLPGKLSSQIEFMDANPDCSAVYTNAIVVDNVGNFLGMFNNPQPTRFDINAVLRFGNFLNHSSLLYRSEYARAITELVPPFIDYLMHLRLAAFGSLAYINRPCVIYRMHSSTSMIVNANEHTRQLYWEALTSVDPNSANRIAIAAGKGDFLRRVFLRSARIRSPSLLVRWCMRVLESGTPDRSVIVVFALASIFRTSFDFLSEWVGLWLARGRSRVFYRR